MFYGFNVELNEMDFEDLKKYLSTSKDYRKDIYDYSYYQGFEKYKEIGNNTLDKNKELIEKDLENYINVDGTIDASTLENDWFPSVEIDIFLSHSHMDSDNAIILAGLLEEKFGLRVFIDSCVWGYADDLFKKIDNKYCKNSHPNSYSYEKRNKSTSYVHLLLNGALMKMINKSKCVMFLNTNNSLTNRNTLLEGNTSSPWIYSELLMTNILLENQDIIYHSEEVNFDLSMRFPIKLENLIEVKNDDLKNWLRNTISKKDDAISKLYQIVKKQVNVYEFENKTFRDD